jgi:pimeloyl-ACP methyl ester carboxylesterase
LGQSERVSATEQTIDLDRATIRYRVTGDGPTVVFVHGVWVAGPVWNDVVERLDGMRCIVPTWPLGAHADPAPTADLSARATAKRIPDFLEALDLHDVTLVGNDTGGGLCLGALGAERPGLQRISRLVLTNCDSYEHLPPRGFDKMVALMRRSSTLGSALLRFFASSLGQRVFLKGVCVTLLEVRERERSSEPSPTARRREGTRCESRSRWNRRSRSRPSVPCGRSRSRCCWRGVLPTGCFRWTMHAGSKLTSPTPAWT